MARYEGHISETGVEALRSLIGARIQIIYAPEITTYINGLPPEARRLTFWTAGRTDEFVNISTDWVTTKLGFDYHTYVIESSPVPKNIKYKPKTSKRIAALVGPSSLQVGIGELERIEIIEAHCITSLPDDELEIVNYDRCIRFIGTSGNFMLCTDESILGAIEISNKGAPDPEAGDPDEVIESYRVRLALGSNTINHD